MEYKLRPYQQEAADKAVAYLKGKDKKNGIIILPTGGGKSLIISEIAHRLDGDVIVFQPSKEILEQNFAKLQSYGVFSCSIYSASCNTKEISRITFATIGSVRSKPEQFKHFRYAIIDECHLFNPADGMYRQFLSDIGGCKTVGLTATPYRLYSNMEGSMLRFITRTRPRYFTDVIYTCQVAEIQRQGFLSKMEYYALDAIDIKRLRINSTGQNYTDQSVKDEYQRSGFFGKLCNVVERLLHNAKVPRKGILVFTKFIEEAEDLCKHIPGAAIVTGSTPKRERERILKDFRDGRIKVVANVGVLTTGFDYPELDTIVLARPTRSLAIYYQMVGRAIRPHKDKQSAWIVDLCGTAKRFGAVEDLHIRDTTGRGAYIVESNGIQLTNIIMQ